ncbi:MAG: hypothetical protein JWM36_3521 [Hyphomicrobiales bacterium]|nr:hypothetical protein [Hyphomicrobiales bacterium]
MFLYKTDFEIYSVDLGADIADRISRPVAVKKLICRTDANVVSQSNYCFSNCANRTTLLAGEPT